MSVRRDDLEDDVVVGSRTPGLGRRDLMKLGAGVVATALGGRNLAAQGQGGNPGVPVGHTRTPGEPRPFTGPGYKYTANRLAGNGPMDDTTRKIVKFVAEFNESKMTEPIRHAVNRTMVDSMACIIAGLDEEPVRIAARVARHAQPTEFKSTVFGYGIPTTPELASFANSTMVRVTDFNDNPGHTSNLIPAALAWGEALHSTGAEVMTAIVVGYEVSLVPIGLGPVEPIQAAMTVGKLMKLDEDRLANAVTIALTPHVALNKGVGALSMWKGVRSAEATKCGVWAATLAREGMTGPPQPFEGRGGFWSRNGRTPDFTLPREARMAIERNWHKQVPTEDSSQGTLMLIPEMRAWTKPEDIASIHYDMNDLGEISDAPKWDPRNRETADHSMPFILARALLDGEIYLDSFTEAKYMDPAARALMDKMTFGKVPGWSGLGPARITIRKKNGEERTWDTYKGVRNITLAQRVQMTDEEIRAKFDKVCAFHKVANAQRDRARAIWENLWQVKDINEAIQTLARFGQPKPL